VIRRTRPKPRRRARPLGSLRVRITLAAVLVTTLAVATGGWLIVRSFEDAQVQDVRGGTDVRVGELADRLRDGQLPQAAVEATEAPAPLARVEVIDEQGELVAAAPEPRPAGAPPEPVALGGEVSQMVVTPDGQLTVVAATPVDQVGRNVDFLTHRLAVALAVLVALVGALAWVVVGRALQPVESIRAEVERITGSTMHRRVPEPATDDEVGRLARTMNTMLGRLEASAARQRRFVADASHELRSPAAVLRAGLEVARTRTDPATWTATIDTLLAEETRLEQLLDDLLLLAAHDDNGTARGRTRPVDLAELAAAEARRPRRVPVEVEVEVDTTGDGGVVVAGHPELLARALGHLADNAARHARSQVRITVAAEGSTARLVVDDDGPGIPPADRERVFERFTRLDDARTRATGGTGLGLAVTRSIVESHGGTITTTENPTTGARFTTLLPR